MPPLMVCHGTSRVEADLTVNAAGNAGSRTLHCASAEALGCSMSFTTIEVNAVGVRGTITLNRPDKLNPLSTETLRELADAAHWFDQRPASCARSSPPAWGSRPAASGSWARAARSELWCGCRWTAPTERDNGRWRCLTTAAPAPKASSARTIRGHGAGLGPRY